MKLKLKRSQRKKVENSQTVYTIIREYLQKEVDPVDREKEHFFAIGLKMNMEIGYIDIISIGDKKSTIVGVAEVFKRAIKEKAISSIIICHNHPSENRQPSRRDKQITKKLVAAGRVLEIQVLDHIIVTLHRSYFSFADEGLM